MARLRPIVNISVTTAILVSLASGQVPTGKIIGKVVDEQGAPLPGVSIVCESKRQVGKTSTITDATGAYRLLSLPSGTYAVTFSLQGFERLRREEIVLLLEQTISLNVTLKQSVLAEEVTVAGQNPLIDVKSTTKGGLMTRALFMQLPRSRNFDGLLSTIPGVQFEDYQTGLSVDGASGSENVWYVDGTNITDIHIGVLSQTIVMEQLEEVKVTSSGLNAEFGGAMGGVVSVISRSGENEFHGDVFGYYENNRLWMQGKARDSLRISPYAASGVNAADWGYYNSDDLYYEGGKKRDDTQRIEGVFNLGGYILKDRLWFFASFNPTYSRTYADRWFITDPADVTKAKAPGDTIKDPQQGRPLYEFYSKKYNHNWQAKFTVQLLKGLRASISAVNNFSSSRGSIPSIYGTSTKYYSYRSDWNPIDPSTNQGLATAGKEPGFDYPNWSANATIDWTLTNKLQMSLRGGWFRQNTANQRLFVPGTSYSFSGTNMNYPEILDSLKHYSGWSNGAGTAVTKKRLYERLGINFDLTYYLNWAGEHAWKFGFQFVRLHEDSNFRPQSPLVTLYWGRSYYMPDGTAVRGKYGYYQIRNDWVSPYGSYWDIASNNWSVYLQDSWTTGDKLTLNFGLRAESEYIPSFLTTDPNWKDYRPIRFDFGQKIAPRLGVIYDVFGDSSLKIYASFGLYYDTMKLRMAEIAYGGVKSWISYYTLDDYDFTKIAASGDINNRSDQTACGTYMGSRNLKPVDWESTDPGLRPAAQSEFSFGTEKKLTDVVSFSARLVYKHLNRTVEDMGLPLQDEFGIYEEKYFVGNPGEGATRPVSQGGRFSNEFWPPPRAKREYMALNLALEKRFSKNWQGGVNFTWSRLWGNYGGLSAVDAYPGNPGTNYPNSEMFWNSWYERYDIYGQPLDGILPSDRTFYIKTFGSYVFPFGLTVGFVGYGRSGLPQTTLLWFNDLWIFPDGYFDTGERAPFTAWADLYLEYELRLSRKYKVNLNATISNITNTRTIQSIFMDYNYDWLFLTNKELLAQRMSRKDWKTWIVEKNSRCYPVYGWWYDRFGPWSWHLGARFSF